ncbi:MAG: hypothetical protein PHH01_00085 [Patescibacteria group bacterium]|nr:hypothetical protein [Patescibacteria group bacterium]
MSDQIIKYWEEQLPVFSKIKALGFNRYINTLPDFSRAFMLKDNCLRCIDEGTPGGIRLAGSGILLSENEAISVLKNAAVDGIYSHEECGAAKLYAKENNLDPNQADKYGQDWAKKLAKKFNIGYKGFLKITEMARPSGFHIARVAYYDGTGKFNPDEVKGLPSGFVISRRYLNREYALKEMGIAISIALSDHGFGELITPAEPFFLVPIGDLNDSKMSLEELTKELQPLTEKYQKRVIIDGFAATI